MKKIALAFLLVGLFINCDRNPAERVYRLQVKNASEMAVTLDVYEPETKRFVQTINIMDGDLITYEFVGDERDNVPVIRNFFEGDSVKIQFGDSNKGYRYKCDRTLRFKDSGCGKNGNILNDGDEKWIRKNNGTLFSQTYTFTAEDFQNVEVLE